MYMKESVRESRTCVAYIFSSRHVSKNNCFASVRMK